ACQNDPIPERVTFKSTPLDSVYQDLRPEVQEFSILNNQPNKIKATKGTEIFVPENSFVDAGGNPIKGEVEVKLIEAFSMEDFITSGLATQSNGQLLISNGMINIDATAGGKAVELQEGKELTVSMPTMERNMEGFQMFTGDGQNWEVDSSMMEEDYLIPVPLELLYEDDHWILLMHRGRIATNEEYFENNGFSFKDKKYEKTIIATEAFKNRLEFMWYLTHNISILKSRDFYFGNAKRSDLRYNLSIWKVYSENLDKPIEELDKLARQKYIQFYDENEEELSQFFEKYKKEFIFGDYSTPLVFSENWDSKPGLIKEYFLSKTVLTKEYFLYILDNFSFKERGKIKLINDHGVDLNSKDASSQLKDKGLSSNEINEILTYNFKRNAILNKFKREKEAQESHAAISDFYETTVFSAKKLGWINCDRFYNSPNAKEAKILASNSSKTDLNFIDFSLIFPKLNARLSASINADGKYAFTSSGRYSKLPLGEKAIFTGISFQNDSIYYAAQEIVIEENMEVDLDLKLTSKEELRDELSKLLD
ncbi:MAG: hypothetical protein ACJAT4_001614, partial [Granulosicoccus sp.]